LSDTGYIHIIRHNGPVWECYYKSGTAFATVSTTIVPIQQWVHHAIVRSGSTVKWYINGVERGSGTDSTSYANACYIQNGLYGGYYYDGYVSNFRFVKGTAVYTANFTPSTSPLTAITGTSLLTCQSRTFIDNSTNNFTLTVNGETAPRSFNPFGNTVTSSVEYSVATVGGSMYFDGNGDWLSLGNITNLALGAGNFTWESWIYLDITTLPAYAGVYDQRNGTNGVSVIQPVVELTNTNGYAWYVAAGNRITSGTAAVKMKSWQHLAVCRSSGVTKMFIDGVQVGSNYTDSNTYPSGTITIGRENDGVNTRYLTGYLSGLRIILGQALYTTAFASPTSPPTPIPGTILLLNGTSSAIIDYTGKNTLQTFGNAVTSNTVTKYGSRSLYFDGVDDAIGMPYSPIFNFDSGQFTIECWVNFSTLSGNIMLFDTYTSAAAGGGYQLYWRGTGTSITFYANGVVVAQSSFTSHVTGTWYHVACTRDSSGTVRIFVNGTSYASATYTSAINMATTGRAAVGMQLSTSTNDLHGYIDDLRITKGYARYTANFTAPTSTLLAK